MSGKERETTLKLDNISLSFGGVKAISNISFEVLDGEICAVIGPNGAGKSSMLNVINGVYHPQEGTITFQGKARHKVKPRDAAIQGIARTFQNIGLFQGMTVLDNLMSGRNLQMKSTFVEQAFWFGRPRKEELHHREKVEEIVKFLQLESLRHKLVSSLSYGMQKKVELGRALASEPRMLLLDEPMAGMNLEEKLDLSCYILEVNREFGTTFVLIEHDMGVVMDIADHVVVLDYGRKIGDGSPEEVMSNQEVLDAYLGVSH